MRSRVGLMQVRLQGGDHSKYTCGFFVHSAVLTCEVLIFCAIYQSDKHTTVNS